VDDATLIELDICIVWSLDEELVNKPECERGEAGRPLFDDIAEAIPGGVHDIQSQPMISGTPGTSISVS
jgi:hypothetical protein